MADESAAEGMAINRWRRPVAAAAVVAPVVGALIVLAAVFFRQVDIPKYRTMWAEDGQIFAQCLFDRSVLDCLVEPYQGYLHEVPRLAAMLATAGWPELMPFLFTLSAGLVAAGCAGAVAIATRDVTGSTIAGIGAGASLALVWQAGREVLGNVANVSSLLLMASIVVLAFSWLGRRLRTGDLVLIGATALSSALVLILPILAAGAVVTRTRDAWRNLALITALAIPQTIILVTATRRVPDNEVTLRQAITGFQDFVLTQGWFGGHSVTPDAIVPLALVALTVSLPILSRLPKRESAEDSPPSNDPASPRGDVESGPGLRLLVLAGMVSIGVVIFFLSVFLNRTVNPRYGYAPAAMIAVAVAVAGGWVALEGGTRTLQGRASLVRITGVSVLAVAVVLGVGYAMSFRLVSRASRGPNVVSALHRADVDCGTGLDRVTVPISPRASPPVWTMTIPCERFGR